MGSRSRPSARPRDEAISHQMSRMPRGSTKPEVALRRELHARGVRFRLHRRDLPGTPDLVLVRPRVAVFVDGCFWHSCPEHGTLPKNNREWWRQKLSGNIERDRRKDAELLELGWTPLHIWEHEPVDQAADRLEELWQGRTH
ncbi:MAG: very short patch repair endonuclease [Actinomycetota bacterium]